MSSNDTLEQLRDDIDSGEPGTKSPLLILRWRRSVLTMRLPERHRRLRRLL
jgi:hypothetical protein